MDEVEDFLEHFGVKGMQWGVRRSKAQAQAKARQQGLGANKLKSENRRVSEAGGGIRGTLKVRKEMIKTGELSKSDARKGALRFGRNVAIAAGAGAAIAAGATFAYSLKMNHSMKKSLSAPSNMVYRASGKNYLLEYGDKLYPEIAKLVIGK